MVDLDSKMRWDEIIVKWFINSDNYFELICFIEFWDMREKNMNKNIINKILL